MARNSPTQECYGKCTAIDKSVLFRAQKGFGYDYGTGFRNKNLANSDKNIFKAGESFETEEERRVMGIIDIREREILITSNGAFMDYIIQWVHEISEVNRYGEDGSLFLGGGNSQKVEVAFQGISMATNDDGGKIKISKSHISERSRRAKD